MEKLKKMLLLSLVMLGVLILGAWTPVNTTESIRYVDGSIVATTASETIHFTRREQDSNTTPFRTPVYESLSGYSNSCGSVAGGVIVGYYDKYYPNLIPDWDSYYSNGIYRLQDSVHVHNLIDELYTLMRTNVDDDGVSESDFKSGLKTYINNHGYNVDMQNLGNSKNFDFEEYKNAIDNNKVVAILSKACKVYLVTIGDTYDELNTLSISSSHIMVGHGYAQFKYYNEKGLFRTDTYLLVTVGTIIDFAYYKIDTLNAAYTVDIY